MIRTPDIFFYKVNIQILIAPKSFRVTSIKIFCIIRTGSIHDYEQLIWLVSIIAQNSLGLYA
jgi:hypothetical protein